jgi:hypothetical protein
MITLMLMPFIIAADVESGPKAGTAIPALNIHFATGTHEGKEVDWAAERKEQPTLYLFIPADKFARPTARFLKELDGKLKDADEKDAKAAAVVVWTGGEADKHKDYLPKVQQSLKFERTDLAWSTNATPEGWGLNSDAHLTVVVAKGGKAAKVFAFTSVNEKDVPAVLEAVKK